MLSKIGAATGATVSTVKLTGAVFGLSLPAASFCEISIACGPSAKSVVGVKLQLPVESTTAVPISVPSS